VAAVEHLAAVRADVRLLRRTDHGGRRAGRPSRGRRGDPDGGREASPTCPS